MNENNINELNNQNNTQFNNKQFNQINNNYDQQSNSNNYYISHNNIVQPSSNPGYQVNNSFNSKFNNNQTYQNKSIERMQSVDKTSHRTKINFIPLIIIVIVIMAIFLVFKVLKSFYKEPLPEQKIVEDIVDYDYKAAETSAYNYASILENYIMLSLLDTENNYIKVPSTNNGIITCSKINSDIWQGEVDATSSSCDDFLTAVNNNVKGQSIDGGKITFDQNGKIYDKSWIIFNNNSTNIYCLYEGEIPKCSNKKPE